MKTFNTLLNKILSKSSEIRIKKKRKAFYSQFISKGELCFDIGANNGNRTEIFLELNADVIAVEPQKECSNELLKKFKDKIVIVEKGVSDTIRKEKMYLATTSTISTFSTSWVDKMKEKRFKEFEWNNEGYVEMTTLDQLISQYGLPKFCKIDVEGYEVNVLKGLTKPIQYISFEYAIPEFIENIFDCLGYLKNIGNFKCNYTVGEMMELVLESWVTPNDMINIVRTESFIKNGFGDIYISFEKL